MKIYKKSFWNILRAFSIPLYNFLIMLLGMKIYGKAQWGALLSILLWVNFLIFITKWNGQDYLIRQYSQTPSKKYSIFYSNLILRSCLLLTGLLLFFFYSNTIAFLSLLLIVFSFVYNSFDSLIIYEQKYAAQLIAESLGCSILAACFFVVPGFSLENLMLFYIANIVLKIIVLLFFIKIPFPELLIKKSAFSLVEIKTTLPFFLIGFGGWLSSKIDTYLVSHYFSKEALSEYQIFISCILMLQALSNFIAVPLYKYIYRMPERAIQKSKDKIALMGIPLVIFGIIIIWLVLTQLGIASYSWEYYLAGALVALPSYFYIIDGVQLYRKQQEVTLMKLNFILVFMHFILMLILIPIWQLFGVLLSVCVSQWIFLFVIKCLHKKVFLK